MHHETAQQAAQRKNAQLLELRGDEGGKPVWEGRPAPAWAGTELLSIPQPQWLLPPVFQQRQMSVVAGPSNVWKTFFMVDVAMTLATGSRWEFMSRTSDDRDPVPVVFVEAEGADTLSERAQAWLTHRGLTGEDLPDTLVVPKDVPNLFTDMDRPGASLEQLLSRVAYEGAQFVVIDTLHASAAGANTNAPEDMNRIVASMRRIRDEAKAAVCIVHHHNKSGEIGGANVLFAAVDTVVEFDPSLVSALRDDGTETRRPESVWVSTTKQRRYPIRDLGKLHPVPIRYRDPWPDAFDPETDGVSLVLVREGEVPMSVAEKTAAYSAILPEDRDTAHKLWLAARRSACDSKNKLIKEASVGRTTALPVIDQMLEAGLLQVWSDGTFRTSDELPEL